MNKKRKRRECSQKWRTEGKRKRDGEKVREWIRKEKSKNDNEERERERERGKR